MLGKLSNYLFFMFTFAIYIRTILQAYMIVLLGSLRELHLFDLSGTDKIISFGSSILIVILLLAILGLSIYVSHKSANKDYDPKKSYFGEFVKGTKVSKLGRQAVSILLLRIILSVTWIVFAETISLTIRTAGYAAIHFVFAIINTIIRPLEEFSPTFISIADDWIYVGVCCLLIPFNTEEAWSKASLLAVLILLTANGVIIAFIQFLSMLRKIYLKCKKKKENKSKIQPDVTQDIQEDRSKDGDDVKRRLQSNSSYMQRSNISRGTTNKSLSNFPSKYSAREVNMSHNDMLYE